MTRGLYKSEKVLVKEEENMRWRGGEVVKRRKEVRRVQRRITEQGEYRGCMSVQKMNSTQLGRQCRENTGGCEGERGGKEVQEVWRSAKRK